MTTFAIGQTLCGRAYLVDGIHELPLDEFSGEETVVITAGASAPEVVVEECLDTLVNRFHATVEHPVVLRGMDTPPETIVRLQQAGARPIASFTGIDPGAGAPRWDPLDADYPPIRGAGAVHAPGPNLTVWSAAPAP